MLAAASLIFLALEAPMQAAPLDGADLCDADGRPLDVATALAAPERVRALNLSGAGRTELPAEVRRFKELRTLEVQGGGMKSLPDWLAELGALERLDLSGNPLGTLPLSVLRLGRLRVLAVRGCRLAAIPESISTLPAIEDLDVGGNLFSTLPESLGELSRLAVLHVTSHYLHTLPPSAVRLTRLRELAVYPVDFADFPLLTGLPALEILRLNGGSRAMQTPGLTEIPPSVLALWNAIDRLPVRLGDLTALRTLRLAANKLTAIPPSLARLSRLAELDLRGNPLPEAEKGRAKSLLPKARVEVDPC